MCKKWQARLTFFSFLSCKRSLNQYNKQTDQEYLAGCITSRLCSAQLFFSQHCNNLWLAQRANSMTRHELAVYGSRTEALPLHITPQWMTAMTNTALSKGELPRTLMWRGTFKKKKTDVSLSKLKAVNCLLCCLRSVILTWHHCPSNRNSE